MSYHGALYALTYAPWALLKLCERWLLVALAAHSLPAFRSHALIQCTHALGTVDRS